jgi:hypothetical protein
MSGEGSTAQDYNYRRQVSNLALPGGVHPGGAQVPLEQSQIILEWRQLGHMMALPKIDPAAAHA